MTLLIIIPTFGPKIVAFDCTAWGFGDVFLRKTYNLLSPYVAKRGWTDSTVSMEWENQVPER